MSKTVKIVLCLSGVFFLMVYYNYQVAQKAIKETKSSVLYTDVVNYPKVVKVNTKADFVWQIQVPNDLSTSMTAIYWGYDSSPSGATITTPPESTRYPYRTTDYLTGLFKLPDTFDTQTTFPEPRTVYFRSFAKVNNQYLWSKEYSLIVLP